MKKAIIILLVILCGTIFAISTSATAPIPEKPDLGIDFGTVSIIDGFEAPSALYANTDERVLLTDGNDNYVTYPTYYVTKDNATFDFDFSKLNTAQSVQYSKKSVVMVEIPEGVTTISNSYFAGTGNFPLCIYVQFPGSITSYGSSLFAGANTVIRSVEFLDGIAPITMGDSMFGGQWNGGAHSIEYVKFPNNLVSIGNNTFGKANGASKTIIFGKNLENIGTNFFGESTPSSTDTFMYVSDKFFTQTEVFSNLFGSEAPYHGNNLMLTMFYTGTRAQAEELVAKGLAVQTGYVWDSNKVKIVSASEYDYATHKPTSSKSITIVYDYNTCNAFYGAKHLEDTNPCLIQCTRCGQKEQDPNANHSFDNGVIAYESGYAKNGTLTLTCQNEGCVFNITPSVESVNPIFELLGFSTNISKTKMVAGYKFNRAEYSTYGKELSYGVVAYIPDGATCAPLTITNGEVTPIDPKFTIHAELETEYEYFDFLIVGIPQEKITLSMCAYVYDGITISYLNYENGALAQDNVAYAYYIENGTVTKVEATE